MRYFSRYAPLAAAVLTLSLAAQAQESHTTRLRFKRGRSSAVVEDAVVRGTQESYVVGARAGQRLQVSITSLEKNAAFHIRQPGGKTLPRAGEMDDATRWSGKLPRTGDYTIVVGSTRGNATFKLSVAIR